MFYFFSRDKKNVCFKVGAKKKKLCANFSEKKNITESNNLAPPPPEIKWCVPYNETALCAKVLFQEVCSQTFRAGRLLTASVGSGLET